MPDDVIDEINGLKVEKTEKDGKTLLYVGPFQITKFEKSGQYFEIPEQLGEKLKNFKLCWLFNEEGDLLEAYSIDEENNMFVIKDITPFPTGCCIDNLDVDLEKKCYSPDDIDKIKETSYKIINNVKHRDWDKEFYDNRTGYA